MFSPAPTAEVRFEKQPGLSAVVCQTIDELSGKAVLTPSVQKTPPGTVGRREAVLHYVQRYWPRPDDPTKVRRWFSIWVTNIRRDSLTPQVICEII